jgi:deazaflavin-dependent oxidoreductase (nitroreductase family)
MPVQLTPSGTRGATMPKMPPWLMKVFYAIAPVFFRLRGVDTMMLTTTGARSGKEHAVQLSAFPDGDGSWLVIASSGGTAKHPAWLFNMARNPDKIWVQFGKKKRRVEADSLQGSEREAAWQRVTKAWPGYNSYRQKTDREIPVVRLTAV